MKRIDKRFYDEVFRMYSFDEALEICFKTAKLYLNGELRKDILMRDTMDKMRVGWVTFDTTSDMSVLNCDMSKDFGRMNELLNFHRDSLFDMVGVPSNMFDKL